MERPNQAHVGGNSKRVIHRKYGDKSKYPSRDRANDRAPPGKEGRPGGLRRIRAVDEAPETSNETSSYRNHSRGFKSKEARTVGGENERQIAGKYKRVGYDRPDNGMN